jgi:Protein of unknown function (DUF2778)
MMQRTGAPLSFVSIDWRHLPRRIFVRTAPGAAALGLGALVGAWIIHALPEAAAPTVARAPAVAAPAKALALAANPYGNLIDPGFSLGQKSAPSAKTRSLEVNPAPVPASAALAMLEPESAPLPPPKPITDPSADSAAPPSAPVPPARPAEFASPSSPLISIRRLAQQNGRVTAPAAAPDNRNFFEKLFGASQPSGAVLAYASPKGGIGGSRSDTSVGPVPAGYDHYTAIYDLSAHMVYLPNGTRLEAHSGLGDRLDDPRHVSERDRGATPPHLYDLAPREESFHGVQALRLTPVGGGDIYGRAGLLAHSYMLGPNGDSNGCVSFKDYEAFLQAYQNGQIKRLAVVASLN